MNHTEKLLEIHKMAAKALYAHFKADLIDGSYGEVQEEAIEKHHPKGGDWMHTFTDRDIPGSAYRKAWEIIHNAVEDNPDQWDKALEIAEEDPKDFGLCLALEALGTGISWSDDHDEHHELTLRNIEYFPDDCDQLFCEALGPEEEPEEEPEDDSSIWTAVLVDDEYPAETAELLVKNKNGVLTVLSPDVPTQVYAGFLLENEKLIVVAYADGRSIATRINLPPQAIKTPELPGVPEKWLLTLQYASCGSSIEKVKEMIDEGGLNVKGLAKIVHQLEESGHRPTEAMKEGATRLLEEVFHLHTDSFWFWCQSVNENHPVEELDVDLLYLLDERIKEVEAGGSEREGDEE